MRNISGWANCTVNAILSGRTICTISARWTS
jgi:hypothetical protein